MNGPKGHNSQTGKSQTGNSQTGSVLMVSAGVSDLLTGCGRQPCVIEMVVACLGIEIGTVRLPRGEESLHGCCEEQRESRH